MFRYVRKDRGQGACTEGGMIGDRDVMLAVLVRRQTYMASGLAGDFITENLKFFGEVFSR